MKRTILVVDDDRLMLRITESFIGCGNKDYDVIKVDSGKACIEILKNEDVVIDVIMLDYQMPEMDGVHTLKQIRAIPEMKDMKIIFYTSEPKEDIENALKKVYPDELGQLHYLIKPSSPETISIAIQSVL